MVFLLREAINDRAARSETDISMIFLPRGCSENAVRLIEDSGDD